MCTEGVVKNTIKVFQFYLENNILEKYVCEVENIGRRSQLDQEEEYLIKYKFIDSLYSKYRLIDFVI